MQINTHRH